MGKNEKATYKSEAAQAHKQHRVSFFLGVSAATGWEINYEELDCLAEQTTSIVECIDVVDAMRAATSSGRVSSALVYLGKRREREAAAARVKS